MAARRPVVALLGLVAALIPLVSANLPTCSWLNTNFQPVSQTCTAGTVCINSLAVNGCEPCQYTTNVATWLNPGDCTRTCATGYVSVLAVPGLPNSDSCVLPSPPPPPPPSPPGSICSWYDPGTMTSGSPLCIGGQECSPQGTFGCSACASTMHVAVWLHPGTDCTRTCAPGYAVGYFPGIQTPSLQLCQVVPSPPPVPPPSPPPPLPPVPPPSPPPPSPPLPSPPPLPVMAFFPVTSCPEVAHRFTAAAWPAGGSSPAADAVAASSWSLAAVQASGGAPVSNHTGAPMLSSGLAVAATADPFNAAQRAWVLHNAAGLSLQTGASRSLGGARGFSLAAWFRLDDAGASNPTQSVVLQLVLSAGGAHNVTLTLAAAYNQTLMLSLLPAACCSPTGVATTDLADYAVSSSTDEFTPPPNNGTFSVGTWQHVVVAFDGRGVQSGLFWNGEPQAAAAGWAPVNLGVLAGAPPYAVTGGALGFDTSGDAFLTPLWGAVGDVQAYNYAVNQAMALGLYTSSLSACISTPPPPQPPAPPGGASPPPPSPPSPPSPPPLAPHEFLSPTQLQLCIAGLSVTQVLEYDLPLREGVGAFLTLAYTQVRVVNVTTSTGCGASSPPPPAAGRRHLLQPANGTAYNTTVNGTGVLVNASSVLLSLTDVPASVMSGGPLAQLYNTSVATGAASTLSAALNAALVAAGYPAAVAAVGAVGTQAVAAPRAPPPPQPPPRPPGVTPASQLAAANANKHTNRSSRLNAAAAGEAVAYALAAIVVLWLPVHSIVHAATSAHARRTAVSVAVALRCEPGRGARLSTAGAAAEKGDEPQEDEESLAGKRFGAPALAAALAAHFMRASCAASTADAVRPPGRVALRPLLRKPLLSALDASQRQHAGEAAGHLALRKKPSSALWRAKRWLASELHWQARELRHAARALRRCCGSRDPTGKAFRLVAAPAASAVLFEATFTFGWRGRDGAACWRRELRDGALLAALEAALAAELGATAGLEVTLLEGGDGDAAAPVVVALLDDEPHANLDKKRHTTASSSSAAAAADAPASDKAGERTAGVAPAVAARLEAVLALCAVRAGAQQQGPRASAGTLVSADAAV